VSLSTSDTEAGWDTDYTSLSVRSGWSGTSVRGTGTWEEIVEATGAEWMWAKGFTGQGVDVAIIDSGVVPVDGLTTKGKVVNGPDLSFESQSEKFQYLDTFGHGTHLAGLIGGRSSNAPKDPTQATSYSFLGMAPDSRIVSVKVAGHDGATDVSQVIAAIDWIVQHRNDGDLNIRVLNLSFGTDSTQSYLLDPLAYAAEQAWKAGIVVVVAAGNDGNKAPLRNPALDPYVIAVGGYDHGKAYSTLDDAILGFSNCGYGGRTPDLVAPGKSIISLLSPGSRAGVENPAAVVADRFIKGSGTSQSAAIVSGAAALVLEQRPGATPDQVKALLMDTAAPMQAADSVCQGAGTLNLSKTLYAATPKAEQKHAPSKGTGLIEAARGADHLELDGVPLEGEQDIFGQKWNGEVWAEASAQGTSWSGGDWNGTSWSGTSWSGTSWSGTSWSGTSWSGTSWSGTSWSGTSWSNQYWNGLSWSGTSWSGTSWSGTSWSGSSWSGHLWDAGLRWD
jgi:serine protease AprX